MKESVLKNKILVENFTFISFLHVTNLILLLVTVPYLFRVLGSKYYGLVVFAQTIVLYFSIFINFGFNLTATRDISVYRTDSGKISEIVSSVLILKVLFFIISLVMMYLFTLVIPLLKEYRTLYILSMLACLSEALFPVWYFMGIEKMKYITFINVFTRVFATILIFIVIDKPEEYMVYPLILGIGTVTGAFAGLSVVFRRHNVDFRFQSFQVLKDYFFDNLLYFFSNVSAQIYVNANKIIVGTFLGMVEVAYYDVAEKIINIVKVPFSLLGQTLFPKVARDRNIAFLKKIMSYTLLFTVSIIILLFALSYPLVRFLSGSPNINSVNVLRILSISLIPLSVSLFFGDLILVNFGLKSEYAGMRFLGFMIYLILITCLYFSRYIGVYQIASVIVFVESFIALYSYRICSKNSLLKT